MTVRREIEESRRESGEPARRRLVAAANPRLQQKRSWIMRVRESAYGSLFSYPSPGVEESICGGAACPSPQSICIRCGCPHTSGICDSTVSRRCSCWSIETPEEYQPACIQPSLLDSHQISV